MSWSEEHGLRARSDPAGNVVIEVPGTSGYESSPTVVLQGHMDMVCEKTKDSPHDFAKDPISFVFDGDWLQADRTTLGADNGIAIAMALTAALDDDVPHPPLELLFTVDEETGLTGAIALEPDFIQGKLLLNIDSEDEGVFTVGCAGGRDTHLEFPVVRERAADGAEPFLLTVGGLRGGHSGIDIQEQRGNAIHVLARALDGIQATTDARLASVAGGTAHNAIPRDSEAVVFLDAGAVGGARALVTELDGKLKAELAEIDPGVALALEPHAGVDPAAAWSLSCSKAVVDFLLAIPHGVEAFSADVEGLVETSDNLAKVETLDGKVLVTTSQRSSIKDRLDFLTRRIEGVARLGGGEASSNDGYPAWQPNMQSPLLERCKEIYQRLFNKEPVVEVIHAGLECGLIGDKYPGMDMISFGPTIESPHSPQERIQVPSIGLVWDFLAELLKSLK